MNKYVHHVPAKCHETSLGEEQGILRKEENYALILFVFILRDAMKMVHSRNSCYYSNYEIKMSKKLELPASATMSQSCLVLPESNPKMS